jgi:hypothetical protein
MAASLGLLMGMGVVLGMGVGREGRRASSWKRDGAAELGRGATATLGWQLVTTAGERSSGFLSTLGLWQTWRHPEIVVFAPGQDPWELSASLQEVARRVAKGERFEAGKTYVALFGSAPGAFRAVDRRWYDACLGDACDVYQHTDFPVLQLVWPDRDGLFPGERERAAGPQPLLHEPNLFLAGAGPDLLDAVEGAEGLAAFRESVADLCVRLDPATEPRLLAAWSWRLGQGRRLLAVTAFGDLFLAAPDGGIERLETERGTLGRVAESEEEWLRAIPSKADVWFRAGVLRQLRARTAALAEGRVHVRRDGEDEWVDAVERVTALGRSACELRGGAAALEAELQAASRFFDEL